jgi:hypothetical protein
MMSRRELNTRDRDFADVWVFSRVRAFDAAELGSAITTVAEHRNHEIVPLSVALENMPDRQTSYTAMLDRMSYQRVPPASWTELLAEVRAFIDPLFDPQPEALGSWEPPTTEHAPTAHSDTDNRHTGAGLRPPEKLAGGLGTVDELRQPGDRLLGLLGVAVVDP